MFLQVADAAVDDGAGGVGVPGAGGHEAAVDGVDGVGGGGDEEDGVGGNGVDLGEGRWDWLDGVSFGITLFGTKESGVFFFWAKR